MACRGSLSSLRSPPPIPSAPLPLSLCAASPTAFLCLFRSAPTLRGKSGLPRPTAAYATRHPMHPSASRKRTPVCCVDLPATCGPVPPNCRALPPPSGSLRHVGCTWQVSEEEVMHEQAALREKRRAEKARQAQQSRASRLAPPTPLAAAADSGDVAVPCDVHPDSPRDEDSAPQVV